MTHAERLALINRPLYLWRNRVATFGCNVIHPLKRWAGVQVGLAYYTGRQARENKKSVYYDTDIDANWRGKSDY